MDKDITLDFAGISKINDLTINSHQTRNSPQTRNSKVVKLKNIDVLYLYVNADEAWIDENSKVSIVTFNGSQGIIKEDGMISKMEYILEDSKEYKGYGDSINWLSFEKLDIKEYLVKANFSINNEGVKESIINIYKDLESNNKIDDYGNVSINGVEKDAVEYAIDSYVMNTFSRYMGALHYSQMKKTKAIRSISFGGDSYSWDESVVSEVSKWKTPINGLLVSNIFKKDISTRKVMLQIVGGNFCQVYIQFEAINVPTKSDIDILIEKQ